MPSLPRTRGSWKGYSEWRHAHQRPPRVGENYSKIELLRTFAVSVTASDGRYLATTPEFVNGVRGYLKYQLGCGSNPHSRGLVMYKSSIRSTSSYPATPSSTTSDAPATRFVVTTPVIRIVDPWPKWPQFFDPMGSRNALTPFTADPKDLPNLPSRYEEILFNPLFNLSSLGTSVCPSDALLNITFQTAPFPARFEFMQLVYRPAHQ